MNKHAGIVLSAEENVIIRAGRREVQLLLLGESKRAPLRTKHLT